MKKVAFIIVCILFMTGSAMAQFPIKKGNVLINANLSDVDLSFGDGTSFTLNAYGGYFIIDNLAIAGGLGIHAEDSYNKFSIDAGARYYFLEQSKGSFFAAGLLNVTKYEDVDATFGLKFQGGYAFFVNQHISLEPMVSLWLPFSSGYDVTFSIGGGISIYF